ncbi:MAG: class E sortase [Micrococcales bacterium]|nr:class E sortase [Micrococcales bacterium]
MREPEYLADGTKVFWPELPEKSRSARWYELIGEILLTLGIILMLFVGYKAILQDTVIAQSQTELAKDYSSQPSKFVALEDVDQLAEVFGQMYIPRLGDTWTRLIAEGTRWHPVLNEIGIGHYRQTAMPGEVGNFAVAAHRGGFGAAFKDIHRIQAGDRVYVKTRDSWFVYRYLQTKIVNPDQTGVINSVPEGLDGALVGGKYMTLTSCTPIFINTQRIIVWLELESQSVEAPAEMKALGR